MEPPGLMYRIVFSASAGTQPTQAVEGYACAAVVRVTVPGKAASWRRDANCALIRAVRQVLPHQAKATQGQAVGCVN